MATQPQLNPFASGTDPARFPLGRLSTHFAEDGYTDCLLVFPRSKKQTGKPAWSWAATLTFLSGSTTWTSPATKALTSQLNKLSLSEFAKGQYLAASPIRLHKTNRGYWLASFNDVESAILPASDLPPEALVMPTRKQLEPIVSKRKADNIEYDIELLTKRQSEIGEALAAVPAMIDEKRRKLAEIREDPVSLEAE